MSLNDTLESEVAETGSGGRAYPGKDFVALLACLALGKRFILLTTLIAALIGLVVSVCLRNTFESTAKIMPPRQSQSSVTAMLSQLGSMAGANLAAVAGSNLLKDPNNIYLGIARSRPVSDALIQQFDLMHRFRARDMTAARKKLAHETSINSGKDEIITIAVEDHDRQLAADLANGYVSGMRRLTNVIAVTEASQRRMYFEAQVELSKESLNVAEATLKQTQERTGAIQPENQAKAVVDVAAELQQKIAAQELEVERLGSFATPHNIEVQMAERQLTKLRAQLHQVDQNRSSGDPLNLGIRAIAGTQLDYFKSLREFKYRETVLDLLMKQMEAAKLDEARDGAVIQVIEPAIPADRKASPHRGLIVLLSSVLGFLSACAYLFGRAFMQNNPELSQSLAELRSSLVRR